MLSGTQHDRGCKAVGEMFALSKVVAISLLRRWVQKVLSFQRTGDRAKSRLDKFRFVGQVAVDMLIAGVGYALVGLSSFSAA